MRQGIKDVLYVLAVVAASVIAAIAIGWLVAGCSGQVSDSDNGDSGDTETETGGEEGAGVDPGECQDVVDGHCVAPPVEGTYQEAEAYCAWLGEEWEVPSLFFFTAQCDCGLWDPDASTYAYWCEDCSLDWPGYYWTSSPPAEYTQQRWVHMPTTGKWQVQDIDGPSLSVRCVKDL